MHIKPFDRDIKSILEIGFYKIPRFQRPFSWDKGNIEEFWADAVGSEATDYFIGSMVFFKHPKRDEHQVVDGQQRLTTITIILAAVRDALSKKGFNNLAKGIQNVIQRKDINDELRYVLRPETSYPYFQEHVQKFGPAELDGKIGFEEKGIADAFTYAHEKVEAAVAAVTKDSTVKPSRKPDLIKQKLLQIRDRLLSLRVIVVELDNEDDAYIIFETLNSRGKTLSQLISSRTI